MFTHPRVEDRFLPKPADPVFVDIVGKGFYERCKARDVSSNGIGIFVRHDFKDVDLNHEVDLHITLPGHKPFKAIGQIRHRGLGTDHYFGVSLISVDSLGRSLLDDYLRSLK